MPKVSLQFDGHRHISSAAQSKRKERKARKQGISGLPFLKEKAEHDKRKRDNNKLVKMKPEVQNMIAVEESRWHQW